MRHRTGAVAWIFVIVLSVTGQAHELSLVFADDFSYGDPFPFWEAGEAWDLIAHGQGYHFSAEDNGPLWLHVPMGRQGFVLRTQLRFFHQQRGSRPMIRFLAGSQQYQLSFAGSEHFSLPGLQFFAPNGPTVFSAPDFAFPVGEWIDVEVRFDGPLITLLLNGECIFAVEDDSISHFERIMFYNWLDVFDVNEVWIYFTE